MANITLQWDVSTFYEQKKKNQDTAAPSSALLECPSHHGSSLNHSKYE